jgi:hypothetical protein
MSEKQEFDLFYRRYNKATKRNGNITKQFKSTVWREKEKEACQIYKVTDFKLLKYYCTEISISTNIQLIVLTVHATIEL